MIRDFQVLPSDNSYVDNVDYFSFKSAVFGALIVVWFVVLVCYGINIQLFDSVIYLENIFSSLLETDVDEKPYMHIFGLEDCVSEIFKNVNSITIDTL